MKPLITSRCKCNISTRAAKGFGTTKPKSNNPRNPQTKDKDLTAALSQTAKRGQRRSDVRPIDEREAAKGRVDFAQIKDWGDGNQASFGNLQVESFTESYSGEDSRPFYEQLARALELAQNRGLLKVADLGEPFPPFERWVFKPEHYAQYLQDQLTVHKALAGACSAAVQHATSQPTDVTEGEGDTSSSTGVIAALQPFCEDGSLNRAAALKLDVTNYSQSEVMAAAADRLQDSLQPGGMATSYASLLQRLGREASTSAESDKERDVAAAKLFAHAYCVHATHLTTGMRIGAAATEKLDLLQFDAMHFYSDYPKDMRDPLATFVQHVNQTGATALKAHKQLISDEVPGGLLKTSLLLAGIAREK